MGTLPAQRLPSCAGRFYDGTPERLREQVRALLEPDAPRVAAPAIVCPHAWLMYSGAVAGAVYSRVLLPSTAILVGPNHTGFGPPLSVYSEGEWLLPGGSLTVAADLARSFLTRCPQAPPPGLTADAFAHQQDRLTIEAIHALDGEHLHQTVETHQVTMCGYVPTTAVLFAARTLGARQAQLVRYATSADVSGDVHRVV